MRVALEKVQEDARIHEFAKEKAEALATARGQALLKTQNALSEAEEQQIQLGELLRSALEQLGVHSPEKRQSIEDRITSPVVALHVMRNSAGLSGGGGAENCENNTHSAGNSYGGEHHQHQRGSHDAVTPVACASLQALGHENRRGCDSGGQEYTPLSGFTVYSNALSDVVDEKEAEQHGRVTTYSQGRETPESLLGYTSRPDEVGPRTAERLARLVLPHLSTDQINALVKYDQVDSRGSGVASPAWGDKKSTVSPALAPRHTFGSTPASGGEEGVEFTRFQQQDKHAAEYHRVEKQQSGLGSTCSTQEKHCGEGRVDAVHGGGGVRKSRFTIPEKIQDDMRNSLAQSQDSGEFKIKACGHVMSNPYMSYAGDERQAAVSKEDCPSLERKRRAAVRVMQKLNSRLPPEQRRASLVDLSRDV